MSKIKSCSKARRAYKFIESHSNEFNVISMCRVLDVERSGYYAWLKNPLTDRAQRVDSLKQSNRLNMLIEFMDCKNDA